MPDVSDTAEMNQLDRAGTVLIDHFDCESGRGRTFLFANPTEVLDARTPGEVPLLLDRIQSRVDSRAYVAGYLAYEAGLLLDKPIPAAPGQQTPLAWFGVYEACAEMDYGAFDPGEADLPEDVLNVRLNISREEYLQRVSRIKEYISDGDIYQANYTCKLLFEHHRPARLLYSRLRRAHPVGYSAYINTGDAQIISLSPELFIERVGARVLTRPMKGTARRGRWYEQDREIGRGLALDEKNRAENLMILDLMRNDLGRICEIGTVRVPRMFHVERYATVFQMTSDVEGRMPSSATVDGLLKAVFPPGSVTGAPKIRAMEIIAEAEHEPRGVYCGCVGMFRPGGDCLLNVAIRTIVKRGHCCEMGVGSGIVADSEVEDELRETLLKGDFLRARSAEFELLETLRYDRSEGYAYLDEHMARIRRSAEYFGIPCAETAVKSELGKVASDVETMSAGPARVRLLLSKNGAIRAEWAGIADSGHGGVRLLLASRATDPSDVFLYHKTTRREAYDDDLRAARAEGFFDLIYLNNLGILTEGAVTSLALELDGQWYTPPLACGLLPGVWREAQVRSGHFRERVLTLDDLRRAKRVVVGNSVRGTLVVCSVKIDGEEISYAL